MHNFLGSMRCNICYQFAGTSFMKKFQVKIEYSVLRVQLYEWTNQYIGYVYQCIFCIPMYFMHKMWYLLVIMKICHENWIFKNFSSINQSINSSNKFMEKFIHSDKFMNFANEAIHEILINSRKKNHQLCEWINPWNPLINSRKKPKLCEWSKKKAIYDLFSCINRLNKICA